MGKIKDLIGMRFGRLLVLNDTGKLSSTNQIIWKCQCDCGNFKEVCTKDFGKNRYGKPRIQSCGCLNHETRRRKQRTPKETEYLIPTKKVSPDETLSQYSIWECICKRCGSIIRLKRKSLARKHGCDECSKSSMIKICSERVGNLCHNYKGTENISLSYFNSLKVGAKERGILFEIKIDDVETIWLNQNGICALSHMPISFSKKITDRRKTTASLDRIDSSKGYVKGNIQWVHKDINRMKWDFSDSQFIELCKKVSNANPEEK